MEKKKRKAVQSADDDAATAKKKTKVEGLKTGAESEKPVKKVKRPWRSKVRKLAAKKAAAEARAAQVPSEKTISAPNGTDEKSTKKKKKKKKKKYKPEVAESANAGDEKLDSIAESKKRIEAGHFRFLNEKLYTMSGADALAYFKENPTSFDCYHKGFADQVKKWPNHPLREITRWLQSSVAEGAMILDLGCGEANIGEAVGQRFHVRSFDLVAVNERVEACDMAHLPVEESSADVAIFCLSLMGINLYDYIKEARRVLKIGGTLKIAEVTSRFVNVKLFCEAVAKMGFELQSKKQLTDYFIMFEFHKVETVANKRPFGLKLKPCLYKKR